MIGRYLFAGEVGGTYLELGEGFCLRPAEPPRFVYEVAVELIGKLLGLGDLMMCYAHYGMNPSSRRMPKAAREQLGIWLEVIREVVEEGLGGRGRWGG
ncbi:hypothetical protein B6U99_03855 [Candidatus Geothermarchaeota archaeon ex4572_27]|nr:MAG: hypothetical protein B6U99_03855 [Candidatus Geothermarchaeota archaeon ex4572_27]